jgi:hypothetical protein
MNSNIEGHDKICNYIEDYIPIDIQNNIFKYINLENNLNIIKKQKKLKYELLKELKKHFNLKNKILSYFLLSTLSYIDDYLEYNYILNHLHNSNIGNIILNSYNNVNGYFNNISNLYTPLSYSQLSYYNSINSSNILNSINSSNIQYTSIILPIILPSSYPTISSHILMSSNISINELQSSNLSIFYNINNTSSNFIEEDDILNINIIIGNTPQTSNENLFSEFVFANNNNWNNWNEID